MRLSQTIIWTLNKKLGEASKRKMLRKIFGGITVDGVFKRRTSNELGEFYNTNI